MEEKEDESCVVWLLTNTYRYSPVEYGYEKHEWSPPCTCTILGNKAHHT